MKRAFIIIFFICLNLLSLFFKGFTSFFLDEGISYYFLICLYLAVSVYILYLLTKTGKSIYLKKTDIIVLFSFLLFDTYVAFSPAMSFANDQVLLINSLGIIYLLVRTALSDRITIRAIVLILSFNFILQVIYTLYELYDTGNTSHIDNLTLKGTFANSGMFTAYLLGLIPLLFNTILKVKNKPFSISLITISIVISLLILFVTQSRAGFLAIVIVAGCFAIGKRPNHKKMLFAGFASVLFLFLIAISFLFKPDSSLGRVLIWNISSKHYLDKPILGCGMGNFPALYSHWQANYFAEANKTHKGFEHVADITYVCFNEYLQILVETGLLGLILFSILIYQVFKISAAHNDKELTLAFKAVILFYVVFAWFSYPFHNVPILILFIISLGAAVNLSQETPISFILPQKLPPIAQIIGLCACFYTIFWFYQNFKAVNSWEQVKLVASNDEKAALQIYRDHYQKLGSCAPFLLDYGENLLNSNNYSGAIKILEKSNKLMPTEKGYLLTGNAFESMKEYDNAEICYKELSRMVPGHFKPKYQLVKIYLLKKDTIKARLLAKEIIQMPIKIPTDEVFQIKNEMKYFVNNY